MAQRHSESSARLLFNEDNDVTAADVQSSSLRHNLRSDLAHVFGWLRTINNKSPPPCCSINVKATVPASERRKFYLLIGLVLYNSLLLLINMIVAIIFKDWTNIPSHLAVLYFFGLVPGSLLAWMLPAYLAYKNAGSSTFPTFYYWFLFGMLLQSDFYILNAVGIPQLGGIGFASGAVLINDANINVGAFFVVMGLVWLASSLATILLMLVSLFSFIKVDAQARLLIATQAAAEPVEVAEQIEVTQAPDPAPTTSPLASPQPACATEILVTSTRELPAQLAPATLEYLPKEHN